MRIYSERSMFVMHFCLVCNMNKIGSVFVFYILAVAAAGEAELKSKTQSSSKGGEPTKTQNASKTPSKVSTPHHVSAHVSYNNGVGVASISGVESRNGRVSSMAGVNFYPPIDSSMVKTDNKGNIIFKSTDGKIQSPITITKQGDGVSGIIKIMPGSVSVSSTANSGSASASTGPKIPDFNPWSNSFMKPMMNDLYFPDPFPAFPSIGNSAYHTRMSQPSLRSIAQPSFPRVPQPSYSRQPAFTPLMPVPWKDMYKHSLQQPDVMMNPVWYYPSYNPYLNFW